ncbi:MAG: peptidase [Chlamydiae bacterium CG10_big_fil_rev_8_21_14_0_10_42_34]|nr:MAG: peptidase [Chlamydiae bacterium CG10_big_fil_rev_8_21_14_0_10_42_34]
MNLLAELKKWIEVHRKTIRDDYFDFLRFKSISADPAFSKEMFKCSEWLSGYISQKTTMKSELLKTTTFPIVYAEDLSAGPKAATILIYGHYDVQPVDPLDLWKSDPFEPTEREGKIYARGASDNKGQIFYAITAMRAYKELGIQLPVNIKFCIEGEEESSSVGLSVALPNIKEKLKADALLVVDFDQYDPQTAAISLGARGIAAFEVMLTGSNSDLHSGVHGGLAYNPNKALVQLLAKLWDENGKIAVNGFYDDVVETTDEERSQFSFRYDKKSYSKEFGIDAMGGEKGLSLAENNAFRPTLEINGIAGGYAGSGFKTVIPSHAIAKISCRTVPNQDPEKLAKLLTKFLKEHVVSGMKIDVKYLGGEPAFRGSFDSDLANAVRTAASEVVGKPCKNILSGASIPIVAKMKQVLGSDVVGMGYCLPSDDIHAPNENFDMQRFEKGFLTVARTLELL